MNKTSLLTCKQLLDIFSSSTIATAIYTTDQLIIEAATDAMLFFWGRNRDIIGLPLGKALPELAGQPFLDQMREVIRTGITFTGKEVAAQLLINGQLLTSYYDYEYKALRNESGEVFCLLHTATNVTERVLGKEAINKEREHLNRLEKEQQLNEELAAANEELETINETLKKTENQLYQLNTELENRVNQRTQELVMSEKRTRYLIEGAPVAIAVLNGYDLVIESANQPMLTIWGKGESVIGKRLIEAIPELDGQQFLTLLKQVLETGQPFFGNEISGIMEYNGHHREIFTNFVYQPLKDENGTTYSIMVVANEVTEQVMARKAVEASKHRLDAMVASTPVAMTILRGRDLIIETANEAMFLIWQRNAAQTLGQRLIEVFPELIGQPFPELLDKVFDTGKRVAFPQLPVNIGLPDGSSKDIYVNFSYDPIFDMEGKVESILASVIDITDSVMSSLELERNRAELLDTSEQLAAMNEELSATNEELMVSNEELAATNEELISTQSQLQYSIQQINKSQERFVFLLNSIPQQVWTTDEQGILNYVNHTVCSDFGLTESEIIEQGWKNFVHPDDLPKAEKRWRNAIETQTEYQMEFRLLFCDKTYRWHLARAVPLIENEKVLLWIGTNTNIHLQKVNEQKKDEFLSIASHELKTPLTSIKAFNQLLERGGDYKRLSGFIQKSADHILRLEKLIADLLDVSRMNAGKLEYNMQPFNFRKMLLDSVENIQHFSSSHTIILENAVDIPLTGDLFRLEQVLNNFLSNAVKYSPNAEKVIVNSKLENNEVIVSVQDFGIGIAPSHIDKLFDRYYRVDNTAMRFEGLGLGLFICSEILNRHQGKVWIESELGKGSIFYFSLPLLQER